MNILINDTGNKDYFYHYDFHLVYFVTQKADFKIEIYYRLIVNNVNFKVLDFLNSHY